MRNLNAILTAVALLVVGLTSTLYTVDQHQSAMVLRFGEVVREDIGPGLHFKLPLVEQVRRFDRRILTVTTTDERYLTSEQQDVLVDFFVAWKINDVATFYRAASGGNEPDAVTRLNPIVKNALRNVINRSTLRELAEAGRGEVITGMLENINRSAATLGIQVVDVRIKRIDLPDDGTQGAESVLDRVFNRMRADRQEVATRTRAEGKEAAEKIRANADQQQVVILANAERDAQRLRGEGDAKAAEIAAAAYGQDAEFYSFYRSLEAYRSALADGNTTLVLDPDSEFFQYFDDAQR